MLMAVMGPKDVCAANGWKRDAAGGIDFGTAKGPRKPPDRVAVGGTYTRPVLKIRQGRVL